MDELSDELNVAAQGQNGAAAHLERLVLFRRRLQGRVPPRGCVQAGELARLGLVPQPASPVSGIGKALMIAVVLLVLIVELLNSAVEATVDRISLSHQLAKRAKTSTARQFLSLVNVAVVWALVLFG
jgi:hypothetical protein